jgi:hypothetical protein
MVARITEVRSRSGAIVQCMSHSTQLDDGPRGVSGDEPGSTESRLERIVNNQARVLPRAAPRPTSKWGRLALVALTPWVAFGLACLLVSGEYFAAVLAGLWLIWLCPGALHVLTTGRSVRRG